MTLRSGIILLAAAGLVAIEPLAAQPLHAQAPAGGPSRADLDRGFENEPGDTTTTVARAARRAPVPISAAGEALFYEIWSRGGLRHHALAARIIERHERESGGGRPPWTTAPPAFLAHGVVPALAPDAAANDTTLYCGNPPAPPNEAETTIAAWDRYVLTSYNDGSSRCLGAGLWGSQGHAYSVDHGRTFHDGGVLAGTSSDDVFHGDPTVAVNKKTGAFYVSGLMRQPNQFVTGVIALRAHFEGDAFVVDSRRIIAVHEGEDFLDKPWMAVDSLSGHVYITWTNFREDGTTQIELQRCDNELNALGPRQVVFAEPDYLNFSVQGTFPTVGPGGELYIPWTRYTAAFSGDPMAMQVVRSDDLGLTFGPVSTIAEFEGDTFSGAPGSRRFFGSCNIAMAADMSRGPHRGRVYATWDVSLPYTNAPFGDATAARDGPTDGFFAGAVPFEPGGKVRGSVGGLDRDIYVFAGRRGDTFVIRSDTVTSFGGAAVNILCPTDTTWQGSWHRLATTGIFQGVLCGLPYDGAYYLVIGPEPTQTAAAGTYALSTAFLHPDASATVRDNREQVFSYSDNGITWSPPRRLNDSAPGVAGCFPGVAVDDLGRVHVSWLDWRTDPGCGDISDTYMTSSGDGGITWGANRRVTDVSSYWGYLASRSSANQGDYIQITANGDRVYSCFPDSRMNNPDVFVDASVHRSLASGPAEVQVAAGRDTTLLFSLANGGNFTTPLSWEIVESAGWLLGALPGVSGTQDLAGDGGTVGVQAQLRAPAAGGSTRVMFITWDPFIPGHADTTSTRVVSEGGCLAGNVRLEPEVLNPRSHGRWVSCTIEPPSPYAPADIEIGSLRLTGVGGSAAPDPEAPTAIDDQELTVKFRRADVMGVLDQGHSALTASWQQSGRCFEAQTQVRLVPGSKPADSEIDPAESLEFTLAGVGPNPVIDALKVSFTLPGAEPALLALYDVAGRQVFSRDVGTLGPGRHTLTLSTAGLRAGLYLIRLSRADRALVARTIVVR